jgi:hypothetical protein
VGSEAEPTPGVSDPPGPLHGAEGRAGLAAGSGVRARVASPSVVLCNLCIPSVSMVSQNKITRRAAVGEGTMRSEGKLRGTLVSRRAEVPRVGGEMRPALSSAHVANTMGEGRPGGSETIRWDIIGMKNHYLYAGAGHNSRPSLRDNNTPIHLGRSLTEVTDNGCCSDQRGTG